MSSRIAANRQSGQTLIETLVAIFILITGLISAISLAIYSFKAVDASSKQIVATSLAREGIQGIKNIRDNNWLQGTLANCTDPALSGQQCYNTWLNQSVALNPGVHAIDFISNGPSSYWSLTPNPSDWTLYYDNNTGQYHQVGSGGVATIYKRRINISTSINPPYSAQNPIVTVISTVWWKGGNCPQTDDPSTLPLSCKVELLMQLTNWKNY